MMSSISIQYRGFSKDILTPDEISNLFDKIWGKENFHLPGFPQVLGHISALWRSADGNEHHVKNFQELLDAYDQKLTYDICITGGINDNPKCFFQYVPALKEGYAKVTAQTKEIAEEKIRFIKEMCPDQEKPIVFISYDTEELALANFVKDVLVRLAKDAADIFVAVKGIRSGENPLQVMMEKKLKHAQAIISICSKKSKLSPWIWWESSAVWAKGKKVHPLFTNIRASDFGAPLILVAQGKEYFKEDEFIETLNEICKDLDIKIDADDLSVEEKATYEKLRAEYSKPETSARLYVDFSRIEMTQDFHKYSFRFEIENKTQQKFEDIVVELHFPIDYIQEKEWHYPHLVSTELRDNPGYLCLTFIYSNLTDAAKRIYNNSLLPGKKLLLFGEEPAMNRLYYEMDRGRWENRFKYDISWKVFINGAAPQEGSSPLDSLQYF